VTRLIKTEFLKLATVRAFKGLIVGSVAFTLVRFVMVVVSAGKIEASPLGTAASTGALMTAAGSGTIIFLVIGVLAVATEIRHGTISHAFLATPRRWQVVAAKFAAVAIVALAYLFAISALLLGLIAVLYTRQGIPLDTINGELLAAMAGVVIGMPLYAVIGVGLGALIRHQVAAITIPLGWLLIVENLLPSFGLARILTWLPGGATAALSRSDIPGLLPMWGGALLLMFYSVAAVGIGGWVLTRRDIT
jgi:ABC-type transport system involved in multi-copper enzyme maturation permease subunit